MGSDLTVEVVICSAETKSFRTGRTVPAFFVASLSGKVHCFDCYSISDLFWCNHVSIGQLLFTKRYRNFKYCWEVISGLRWL